MVDFALYETGDGSSISIKSQDIELDSSIFTRIYVSLFSTVTDYWANNLFEIDFNSETQKALKENSLDPKGIENIKRAVESDLSNLSFANFDVTVTIENNDKIIIKIVATDNGNLQVIWDITKQTVIEYKVI